MPDAESTRWRWGAAHAMPVVCVYKGGGGHRGLGGGTMWEGGCVGVRIVYSVCECMGLGLQQYHTTERHGMCDIDTCKQYPHQITRSPHIPDQTQPHLVHQHPPQVLPTCTVSTTAVDVKHVAVVVADGVVRVDRVVGGAHHAGQSVHAVAHHHHHHSDPPHHHHPHPQSDAAAPPPPVTALAASLATV